MRYIDWCAIYFNATAYLTTPYTRLYYSNYAAWIQIKKPQHSLRYFYWCGLGDSNSWPLPWQGSALTTELNPHTMLNYTGLLLVKQES